MVSHDKIDVAPTTSFNLHEVEDANETDHSVLGNDDNASIFTGTTQ